MLTLHIHLCACRSSSSSLCCHTPDKRDLLIYSTAPSGYSLPITIDTIGTARCPATCTPDEVARFGWRLLTVTRMKRSCFLCGAQPSFVVFIDNTRRCSDCVNVEDLIGQAKELAAVANDQGEPHRLARWEILCCCCCCLFLHTLLTSIC